MHADNASAHARIRARPLLALLQETDAWLATLFELIPLLDKEVLKGEVLSLALSKGDVEGSVTSRTICARVLGALAPRLVRRPPSSVYPNTRNCVCMTSCYLPPPPTHTQSCHPARHPQRHAGPP